MTLDDLFRIAMEMHEKDKWTKQQYNAFLLAIGEIRIYQDIYHNRKR